MSQTGTELSLFLACLEHPDEPDRLAILADWYEEAGHTGQKVSALRSGKIPTGKGTFPFAACLTLCSVSHGMQDRRFIRTLCQSVADGEVDQMTARQYLHILRLCVRYRRQLPKNTSAQAAKLLGQIPGERQTPRDLKDYLSRCGRAGTVRAPGLAEEHRVPVTPSLFGEGRS